MSDDLRRAAERIKREASESLEEIYGDDRIGGFTPLECLADDYHRLADAYLAEHPADDGDEGPKLTKEGLEEIRKAAGDFDYDRFHEYRYGEPADSDQPITEEWLRSVGFTDHRLGVGIGKSQGGGSVIYCSHKPVGIEPDWYLDAGHSPMTHIHEPKTRGDVRRLCAALGIDLKPVQVVGGGAG